MAQSKAARRRARELRDNRKVNAGVHTSSAMFAPSDVFNRERQVVKYSPFQERPKGVSGKATGHHTLPPTLSSYINPFAASSRGVRYPDAFRGLSGTFSSTKAVTVTTSSGSFTDPNMASVVPALGAELFCITPDPSNLFVQGVMGNKSTGPMANTTNIFYWPNGIDYTGAKGSLNAFGAGTGSSNVDVTIPSMKSMRSMYSSARLVSGGVKFNSLMNFSTVSGSIHIAPVYMNFNRQTTNNTMVSNGTEDPTTGEMQNGWQTVLPNSLDDMVNLPDYRQYPLSSLQSDEIVTIFKRYGEEALLFKSIATAWGMDDNSLGTLNSRYGNSDNPSSYGHYGLVVCIAGVNNAAGEPAVADTSLLELQVTTHYECEFNPASAVMTSALQSASGVSSQAPPHQPLQMAAIDNLISSIPAVRHVDDSGQQEATFLKEVASAWNGAVKVATSVGTAVDIATTLLGAFAI